MRSNQWRASVFISIICHKDTVLAKSIDVERVSKERKLLASYCRKEEICSATCYQSDNR